MQLQSVEIDNAKISGKKQTFHEKKNYAKKHKNFAYKYRICIWLAHSHG